MDSEVPSRRELENRLVIKAWRDSEFRKAVTENPKALLEQHLGRKLPEKVQILVHEEDSNTLHFSIPPAPANLVELSDEELERVAGGTDAVFWISVGVSVAGAVIGVTGIGAGGVLKGTGVW